MAEHLGLGRAPSDRERETLAEDPDAADVLARLRVTGLDRLRQALYQLKLAFAQPVREGVALDEGADVVRRHHADRAERQRRERIGEDDDRPGVKGDLREQQVRRGEAQGHERG